MIRLLRPCASALLLIALVLSGVTQAQARHAGYGAQMLVICTGDGLVRITLDADGQPVGHILPCPECVLAGAMTLVGGSDALTLPFSARALQPVPQVARHSGPLWGVWHDSRAPPVPV